MGQGRRFAIGVDFGTGSVRAVVVDVATGEEVAACGWAYAHGEQGVIVDPSDPNLARQHPADYAEGFVRAVGEAVASAGDVEGFDAGAVVGIGIDATGSTPIPVDADGVALGLQPEFAEEPAALAWLWKDHTSHAEAAEITARAREGGYPYLAKCGGAYSSEWFWSKILRCERAAPRVAGAAHAWVEQADYIPGLVTGNCVPATMPRSACAAGHKGMHDSSWGGPPSEEFLLGLSPYLASVRERLAGPVVASDQLAGGLLGDFADRVGLPAGVPVAVGIIDAHAGAVGSGVGPGTLVKIIGTSTCDCMVAPMGGLPDIPGVCGIAEQSILPGMLGIEAGQSAVGDIFDWFVRRVAPGGGDAEAIHARLSEAGAGLAPGESGLVALDWHNGNRTVLTDPLLTGMLVGETLHTTPAEIYRALIEATAFGALKIIERLEEYGVAIGRVVNCGGIAERSPLVMQIYADVCNRPMLVSRSGQACALGAAVFGAVVGGAHADVRSAQAAMTGVRERCYEPDPGRASVYRELYSVYTRLHDAFGGVGGPAEMGTVMKDLLRIRAAARG